MCNERRNLSGCAIRKERLYCCDDQEDHFADLAEHEPSEHAKKWMKKKAYDAYTVKDCLKKWGVNTKRSITCGQEDTD